MAVSCCPRCELERERARVADSRLWESGGFQRYAGLLDEHTLEALRSEAFSGIPRHDVQPAGQDQEQVRGGMPGRSFFSVNGGRVQTHLFGSPALHDFVSTRVGRAARPLGARGTFSIYTGGAHLDVHRDIPGCDLALITCLYDSQSDDADAALEVWAEDVHTPLAQLAASERQPTRVPLAVGQSLLLHGGVLPHRVRKLERDRLRVVSLMCFAC
jgi:hypothetical protein